MKKYQIEDLKFPEEIVAKQAFVTRQQPLLDEVAKDYGRDPNGLCVKVFYGNPLGEKDTLEDALWGDHPIKKGDPRKNTTVMNGARVQNILWRYDKSPRVYAVFEGVYQGMRVACHLVDFVEGNHPDDIHFVYKVQKEVNDIGINYGFAAQSQKVGLLDVKNDKLVDAQMWAFDKRPYKETVQEIYFNKGRYGKIYYQNDDRLGVHGGPRKSEERIKYMQLDKIDFEGKTVWDIGCAGGFFLRYAMDRGAKRAHGFDMKDPLEAAFHVGNLLGYFNIDYHVVDLRKEIGIEYDRPDIVFFLSMIYHVPAPQRLFEADTVIYEDNGKTTRQLDKLGKPWVDYFSKIEFVGRGIDHGDKAVYHLHK